MGDMDLDELASALIDGEVSGEAYDARRSDPSFQSRLREFEVVANGVSRDNPSPPELIKARHIALALGEFEAVHAIVAPAESEATITPLRKGGLRLPVLAASGIAATMVVAVGTFALFSNGFGGATNDSNVTYSSAHEDVAEESASRLARTSDSAQAQSDADTEGNRTSEERDSLDNDDGEDTATLAQAQPPAIPAGDGAMDGLEVEAARVQVSMPINPGQLGELLEGRRFDPSASRCASSVGAEHDEDIGDQITGFVPITVGAEVGEVLVLSGQQGEYVVVALGPDCEIVQ